MDENTLGMPVKLARAENFIIVPEVATSLCSHFIASTGILGVTIPVAGMTMQSTLWNIFLRMSIDLVWCLSAIKYCAPIVAYPATAAATVSGLYTYSQNQLPYFYTPLIQLL